MAKASSFEPAANETVIASGVEIKGNLNAEQDVWFDGVITGNLSSQGGVSLGSNARVAGNIKGATVAVAGKVEGNVRADRLLVQAGGQILGDMYTHSLAVGEGALLNGNLRMSEAAKSKNQPTQQSSA